jgi:hypothetical protein
METIILKVPLDLADKIESMVEKYNLNPIILLKAALDQYDRCWEDIFETNTG